MDTILGKIKINKNLIDFKAKSLLGTQLFSREADVGATQ
jgi:hypothetical protein